MTGRMARRLEDAAQEFPTAELQAVADLHWFAKRARGVVRLADVLEGIGDLKDAAAQAKIDCEAAQRELAELQVKLEHDRAESAHMEHEFKKMLAAMKAEFLKAEAALADSIAAREQAVADAAKRSEEIIEKATLEAIGIVADARNAAVELAKAADREAQLREEDANKYIDEARGRLGGVEHEIAAANATLAGIRATIAKYASV